MVVELDVLLAVAPTYVGLTGAAILVDLPVLPVLPVSDGPDRGDLVDLAAPYGRRAARGCVHAAVTSCPTSRTRPA